MAMLTEQEHEDAYLGQFIPIQYHHNLLMDSERMRSFKAAIDYVVAPGSRVLELGGGTGVLSWFAAAKAEQVWCVEWNPDLVAESRRLLALNRNGHKVEVVHADAFDYLPPHPVDVVICEMIHAAMLREKQVDMMESFKRRYRQRFGAVLPLLVPTAVVMTVQPVQQEYSFEGYHAPIVQFQACAESMAGSIDLAPPAVYSVLDFTQTTAREIAWEGSFVMTQDGSVSSLRFMTKSILAVALEDASTIDWLNSDVIFPLAFPVRVRAGDSLRVSFNYCAGDLIASLQNSICAEVIDT